MTIYPRYLRSNRRYKIRTPKEKTPPEKKIIFQSGVSSVILAIFFIASFFIPKKNVTKVLDSTYSSSQWKEAAQTVSSKVTDSASHLVKGYLSTLGKIQKKTGIDDSGKETNLTAEAKENSTANIQWSLPLKGKISSSFGERIHPVTGEDSFHTGIDIAAEAGTPAKAAAEGTVTISGNDSANGNHVVIEHSGGFSTTYAHLESICKEVGDSVHSGEKIGTIGSTGLSTGPHLHFELKINGKAQDPTKHISGWEY